MRVPEYFNELYSTHQRYWWVDKDRYSTDCDAYPSSLLTQATLRTLLGRPPGRALDLGAGEGSDAIRLALLGYQVHAVEISDVAAMKIERFAAAVGTDLKVIVGDIASHDFSGLYDVIICNGVLHYVSDSDKSRVIQRMQEATAVGGINVISLWSDYTRTPDCHDLVPTYCDSEDGLVVGHYKEWFKNLLYYERDKPESAHCDLPDHRHSHIKLVATRPSPSPIGGQR